MVVNSAMKESLISSTKWARFLLILQAIAVGIIVVGAVVVLALGNTFASTLGAEDSTILALLAVVYLLIAVLFIYPLIKGFIFCNAVQTACKTDDEAELLRGFQNMRSFLKFYGILAIILLIIYALIFIGLIIGAIASAA